MEVIFGWPAHTKVLDLRSFLCLANHYQKFIRDDSKKVVLLTDHLMKDQPWRWVEEQNVSFEKLKAAISSKLVLKLPNLDIPFKVHMDTLA